MSVIKFSKGHSPNCQCYECTDYDPYIEHIKNQFGKNANFDNTRNGGVVTNFNNFVGSPDEPWLGGTQPTTTKANVKQIFGDALGDLLGNIIQAKKEGQELPKALDVVAGLGIKTEQAAYNAAQGKAANTIGTNVLKFSPYIIGGIVAFILLFFFILGKKR